MRASVGRFLAELAIAGYGSSAVNQRPCSALPTAAHARPFIVLFGAISRLTRRFVCAHFGAPKSVKPAGGGREVRSYGEGTGALMVKGDHVVGAIGRAHIGG